MHIEVHPSSQNLEYACKCVIIVDIPLEIRTADCPLHQATTCDGPYPEEPFSEASTTADRSLAKDGLHILGLRHLTKPRDDEPSNIGSIDTSMSTSIPIAVKSPRRSRRIRGKRLASTSHLNPRPHQCIQCSKTFVRASQLNEHVKTHNPFRPRPYRCEHCSKRFFREHHLERHQKAVC